MNIPLRERFAITVPEACQAIGVGPTKLYELVAAGAIETTKVGKRRLVLVRSLRRLIEGEPATDAAA
jgi:excisionase family DNA binding protein